MESNTVVLKLGDYLDLKKFKEDTESGKTYKELKNKIVQLENQLNSIKESDSMIDYFRNKRNETTRELCNITSNYEHLKKHRTKIERQNDKLKSENDKLKSMSVIRFVWFKISGKL
jgi:phage shock protein A